MRLYSVLYEVTKYHSYLRVKIVLSKVKYNDLFNDFFEKLYTCPFIHNTYIWLILRVIS